MAKMLRVTDSDVANAVRISASGSRTANIMRSGLEVVIRSGGSTISLDFIERAVDSLIDYFISSGEATKCKRYFEKLYDEQQEEKV
ncbi:MAG: hypothetical protein AAB663_01930 [Patescibacteria group bacterium]